MRMSPRRCHNPVVVSNGEDAAPAPNSVLLVFGKWPVGRQPQDFSAKVRLIFNSHSGTLSLFATSGGESAALWTGILFKHPKLFFSSPPDGKFFLNLFDNNDNLLLGSTRLELQTTVVDYSDLVQSSVNGSSDGEALPEGNYLYQIAFNLNGTHFIVS